MPIYEYRCDNCAHEFETIQKVSDAPLTICPACSQAMLRKKVSAAGFRLKGGGWYETDFKAGNKKNVAGEEKKAKDGEKTASSENSGDTGGAGKSAGEGGKADRGKADGGKAADGKSSGEARSKGTTRTQASE